MAALSEALEKLAHNPGEEDAWLVPLLLRVLPHVVGGLLEERQSLLAGDGVAVERAIQRLLQPVGRSLMEGTWSLQGHDRPPATPPTCGHCGHRLRLVDSARPRHLTTPFGPKTRLPRPYYVCPDGHHGWAAGDEAWHLGPGHLSPAMTQIVAEAGARLAFGEAARLLGRTLGVTIDDNDIERMTENIGMLVDAQAALRAEAPAPEQPPDPGSDVLLLCVDGGRVHAGGEWREAKCAAVAALGPKTVVDDRTGRSRLVVGDKHYAATIASSDDFFSQRVRPLAEDFGLHHPRVHTVALLADGGPWIEKRWGTLGIPPTIAVVDILDIRHLEEHLHACADAVFGEHTPRAEAWAKDLSAAVRRQGPAPLRQALQKLHPQTKKAKARARRFGRYVEANAHRLDYPSYRAQGLPIGSGLVEAEVKTVVNQRAKRSGMRWSVPGAQALLAFRALVLSAPACLERFWATHPQVDRLPITMLPGSGRAA